jgi:hypothetical protein
MTDFDEDEHHVGNYAEDGRDPEEAGQSRKLKENNIRGKISTEVIGAVKKLHSNLGHKKPLKMSASCARPRLLFRVQSVCTGVQARVLRKGKEAKASDAQSLERRHLFQVIHIHGHGTYRLEWQEGENTGTTS